MLIKMDQVIVGALEYVRTQSSSFKKQMKPSVTVPSYFSVTVYISYAVHYTSVACLFYHWEMVPFIPLHLFHPSPHPPSPLTTLYLFFGSMSLFLFCYVCFGFLRFQV